MRNKKSGGCIEIGLGILMWGILMAMVLHACGVG
jgi:hypothetical protein